MLGHPLLLLKDTYFSLHYFSFVSFAFLYYCHHISIHFSLLHSIHSVVSLPLNCLLQRSYTTTSIQVHNVNMFLSYMPLVILILAQNELFEL